jgi:hypothetical protein
MENSGLGKNPIFAIFIPLAQKARALISLAFSFVARHFRAI